MLVHNQSLSKRAALGDGPEADGSTRTSWR